MGHDLTDDAGWTAALSEVVEQVVDLRRQIAALEARQSVVLSSVVDLADARATQCRAAGRRMSRADLAIREVSAELGAAMRVTDRTVQVRLGDASTLTTRFPRTLGAWEQGRIDSAHVAAILDAGVMIEDAERLARFEAAVVTVAEAESAGRLRGLARAIAATIDPDAARERHRRAIDHRQVRRLDLGDGMGRLVVDLPALLVDAGYDRLTQMAREILHDGEPQAVDIFGFDSGADAGSGTGSEAAPALVTGPCGERADDGAAGEGRTMDQLRADILADLLLAGAPAAHGHGDALAAITGHVMVTVPVLTAIGAGSEPCLLSGYGPIDTEMALRLAGETSGWNRVLTDPHTGGVLAVDRYRPGAHLRRHLAARDEHCRFPGCRRPALRSDADHTIDAAYGGATAEENLGHFCRRHHTLKHHTAWTVKQRPGGVLEWRSPTGRPYVDRPPATVRFVPTDWLALIRTGAPPNEPVAPF